jgi:hypothetical protein
LERLERVLHCARYGLQWWAETSMKIYLLMVLIGTLLTAIHFTSAPERRSKTLQQ